MWVEVCDCWCSVLVPWKGSIAMDEGLGLERGVPLRDHRNDGVQFGGETNVRDGMEWVAAKVELMRERWEQGLDIWTGEPSEEE